MIIVRASEMAEIDKTCGVPTLELMENAAAAALASVEQMLGTVNDKRISIVTGRGNNGGDGFALARLLAAKGAHVRLVPLADESELSGDALTNFKRANVPVELSIGECDLIVDAILGTGAVARKFPEKILSAIREINEHSAPVLAIDLPTGISADTGQLLDPNASAVRADRTISFGAAKAGHFTFPGAEFTGTLEVRSIGIPATAFSRVPGFYGTDSEIAKLLPSKGPLAHKGESKVLVIGGSQGMIGAVMLAATAAYRSGAGYVFISMPEGVNDPGNPIEAVRRPLSARFVRPGLRFDREAEGEIFNLAEEMHAAVYGGGFGIGDIEHTLVGRMNRLLPCPSVVDGDALRQTSLIDIAESPAARVLSPHPGEFSHLFGGTVAHNEADRVEVTLRAASKCAHVVVHKGRPTIIASPDGRYAINPTGNQLLATAGSGDVLAGVIASLLAQKLPAFEAAVVATYLHGASVELWKNPVGMMASDIASLIPRAWGEIASSR